MTTEQKINMVLAYKGMSQAELARQIGTTPQNFNKKVKRDTFTSDELVAIANVLEATYYAFFEFPDGTIIGKAKNSQAESNFMAEPFPRSKSTSSASSIAIEGQESVSGTNELSSSQSKLAIVPRNEGTGETHIDADKLSNDINIKNNQGRPIWRLKAKR